MSEDEKLNSDDGPTQRPDLAGLPADVEREAIPEWWLRAAKHFEAHELVPYQPPQFTDGTYKHIVEAELEAELGVRIALRCKNAEIGDDWTVLVDGEPVGTIGRFRSRDGYTVYKIGPDEFRDLIRNALADD
jgi:hypothetical protein